MQSVFACWLQLLVCLLGFTGPRDHLVRAMRRLNGTSLVAQSLASTGYGTLGTTRKYSSPLIHLKAYPQHLKSQVCRWSCSLKELFPLNSRFDICDVPMHTGEFSCGICNSIHHCCPSCAARCPLLCRAWLLQNFDFYLQFNFTSSIHFHSSFSRPCWISL